jgi:cytidylate kinase
MRSFTTHLLHEQLDDAERQYHWEVYEPWKLALEHTLSEGVHDPGILKCVFMAGGPGSGKSFVADELFGLDAGFRSSFSHYGLKVVNSDNMFEYLLRKMNVNPKDLAHIEKDDPRQFDFLTQHPQGPRARAKALTQTQQHLYMEGRLGMIVDGTGDDYEKMSAKKKHVEDVGYDTLMVFVNTTLAIAHERNRKRSRSLPDAMVEEIWRSCQHNRERYARLFGRQGYVEVHNSVGGVPHDKVFRAVDTFVHRPVQNTKGLAWMRAMGLPLR